MAASRAADRSALVAYAAARDTCGAAGESPVHVVVAQLPNTGTPTLGTPFTLGDSADWVAPAVVSIGAGMYVVAYPTAAGTIEVQRVDAGAGLQRHLIDARQINNGERQHAGLCALQSQTSQARRRQHKPGASPRNARQPRRKTLVKRLDAHDNGVRTSGVNESRATGAQF